MLRALTWNVMLLPRAAKLGIPPRGCVHGWWENRWAHPDLVRASAIADRLATSRWDLIALQEVFDTRARQLIAARLEDAGFEVFVPPHREKRGHHGLLLASRHPIGRASFESFRRARFPDSISSKGMSATEIEALGVRLLVINAHLQSEAIHADVRRAQLAQMHRFVATHLAASSRPTALLVLGDLNVVGEERPDAPAPRLGAALPLRRTDEHRDLIALLGGPRDLFRERDARAGFTWDGLGAPDGDERGLRRNLLIPWDDKDQQRLDYALAFDTFRARRATAPTHEERPLARLDCAEVSVEPFPFERARRARETSLQHLPLSDHYGVSVTLYPR
ncbi:MAG: endonuclease/exonuclease/phosphatase family protein [Myxococcales bacterium]|nr:endonuclease/exonuclease/phosphatase family protein [Myxococcales bacterium]